MTDRVFTSQTGYQLEVFYRFDNSMRFVLSLSQSPSNIHAHGTDHVNSPKSVHESVASEFNFRAEYTQMPMTQERRVMEDF